MHTYEQYINNVYIYIYILYTHYICDIYIFKILHLQTFAFTYTWDLVLYSLQGIPLSVGSWFGGPRLLIDVEPQSVQGEPRLWLDLLWANDLYIPVGWVVPGKVRG